MNNENSEKKNKIKKNIKFLILVIELSLIAWFGVKMLISGSNTTSTTSTTKKSSSLIQTNIGGGTPPADAGSPFFGGATTGSGSSGVK